MEGLMQNRGGVLCGVSLSVCGQEETQAFSRDGSSQYNLSTGILSSLDVRSNRAVQLHSFIVSSLDRRYRIWENFLVLLVVYTAYASPFEFGFLEKPERPLSITNNVVNGFFAIDIVLTFFVAYLNKATYLLVNDPKKIAWRYTTSWFAFDVISIIPSELAQKFSHSPLGGYGLFNMLQLWRLRRVRPCFQDWRKIGTITTLCSDVQNSSVLLCLQSIVQDASIIFSLLVIMTRQKLGWGHPLSHPEI